MQILNLQLCIIWINLYSSALSTVEYVSTGRRSCYYLQKNRIIIGDPVVRFIDSFKAAAVVGDKEQRYRSQTDIRADDRLIVHNHKVLGRLSFLNGFSQLFGVVFTGTVSYIYSLYRLILNKLFVSVCKCLDGLLPSANL